MVQLDLGVFEQGLIFDIFDFPVLFGEVSLTCRALPDYLRMSIHDLFVQLLQKFLLVPFR